MVNKGVPLARQTHWNLENLRGAITLGSQTVKSLELINGAAAIGVLTFYGNVATRNSPNPINPDFVRFGLLSFALGVALSILTAICAYISQLIAATQEPSDLEVNWRLGALAAGIGSAGLFVLGVMFTALAFLNRR